SLLGHVGTHGFSPRLKPLVRDDPQQRAENGQDKKHPHGMLEAQRRTVVAPDEGAHDDTADQCLDNDPDNQHDPEVVHANDLADDPVDDAVDDDDHDDRAQYTTVMITANIDVAIEQ